MRQCRRPSCVYSNIITPQTHSSCTLYDIQNTDSPTDAQAAAEEEKGDNISDKYDNGAPSQTEEAENTEIEPRSRGYSDSKGTYQNPEDEEPTPTQQGPAGSVVSRSLAQCASECVWVWLFIEHRYRAQRIRRQMSPIQTKYLLLLYTLNKIYTRWIDFSEPANILEWKRGTWGDMREVPEVLNTNRHVEFSTNRHPILKTIIRNSNILRKTTHFPARNDWQLLARPCASFQGARLYTKLDEIRTSMLAKQENRTTWSGKREFWAYTLYAE